MIEQLYAARRSNRVREIFLLFALVERGGAINFSFRLKETKKDFRIKVFSRPSSALFRDQWYGR